MCSISPPVTHVIFDLDGTLINTESILTHTLKAFARSHGKEAEFTEEIELKLLGQSFTARVQQFIKELELSVDLKECMSELVKQILIYIESIEITLMPGVMQLIEYFDQKNIPLSIASNNTNELFKKITRRISCGNFFDRFHHIVLGGDDGEVTHPKPNPDVLLVAVKRFSPIPKSMDQVLVFEDNEIGVEAAIAAGMKCVLIPDQRLYNNSIENSKATVVLRSMRDFNPHLFGL